MALHRKIAFLLVSICASDTVSNVTQGRIIPCLVSTFQAIDELVDENDRRHALEIDGGSDLAEPTIEYVLYGMCALFKLNFSLPVKTVLFVDINFWCNTSHRLRKSLPCLMCLILGYISEKYLTFLLFVY